MDQKQLFRSTVALTIWYIGFNFTALYNFYAAAEVDEVGLHKV